MNPEERAKSVGILNLSSSRGNKGRVFVVGVPETGEIK